MNFFSNPKKHAHPNAKRLMDEDFFWSPIDEAGPFGSDSGADAAQGYAEWRKANKTESPVKYLYDLLPSWGMPLLDWNELEPGRISEFVQMKANIGNMAQQIDQLREAIENSPGDYGSDLSDQSLENTILKSAEGMGGIYLLQMDNAIIGTGFAQLVLEGKMDDDMLYLTYTALKRQLLPVVIDRYGNEHRETRKQILTKMITVVENSRS